jgi:hypothetical protein
LRIFALAFSALVLLLEIDLQSHLIRLSKNFGNIQRADTFDSSQRWNHQSIYNKPNHLSIVSILKAKKTLSFLICIDKKKWLLKKNTEYNDHYVL